MAIGLHPGPSSVIDQHLDVEIGTGFDSFAELSHQKLVQLAVADVERAQFEAGLSLQDPFLGQ